MDEAQNAEPADAKAIASEIFAPLSRVVLIVTLFYTPLAYWGMASAQESLWPLFREIGYRGMPVLTQLLLSPFVPWCVALAGIAGLVKEFLIQNRRVTLIINATHLVCLTALHQIFLANIYLPLIEWLNAY